MRRSQLVRGLLAGGALLFILVSGSGAQGASSPLSDGAEPSAQPAVAFDRVRLAPQPTPIPEFTLTDQNSRPFAAADLRGRTTLIFFGFTNCRSVCPPTMEKLRLVARALQDEKQPLASVFISVDGERDTPEVVRKFLEPFTPGFIGLTGPPQSVTPLAGAFSAIFFKGMPTDSKGGYDVEHTSQVYLLDRQGRLRATFYNAPVDAMVATARDVMHDG